MKTVLCILFCTLSLFAETTLSLEEIFIESRCTVDKVEEWKWIPGEKAISVLRSGRRGNTELVRIDAFSGRQTVLARERNLFEYPRQEKRFSLPAYIWFPDGKRILVLKEKELYELEVPNGSPRSIVKDSVQIRDPVISPSGHKVLYLKSGNLYCFDYNLNKEIQLTHNTDPKKLIGRFDYVYEEEFSIRTGYAWSADESLAFFELDISDVPFVSIPKFLTGQTSIPLAYPRAGQPNARVRLGIITFPDARVQWLDVGALSDDYIPRITWHPRLPLLYVNILNRDQNRLELISIDIPREKRHTVLVEKAWDAWLDGTRVPHFLDRQEGFVWLSERDGYTHLYHYTLEGELKKQLTKGKFDVGEWLGYDGEQLFFSAYFPDRSQTHLWSVGLEGDSQIRITQEEGTHDIHFSACGSVFLDEFSSVNQPHQQWMQARGHQDRVWLSKGEMESCPKPNIEFLQVPNEQGDSLDAWIIKPSVLEPKRKYGVLIYTYGGPGSRIVKNQWFGKRGLWYDLLNELGIIVLAADGRGTARRGSRWRHQVYRRLGQLEAIDQLAVAAYAQSLDFVDPERIGIWGWSYGGYNALRACVKDEKVFKMVISVAPVTDWRLYDTIYTERYMDQPVDNPLGYESGSVLDHVKFLECPLLLVHGSGDDNVHIAHTMQLVNELEQRGRTFDLMVYPDKKHGIEGAKTQIHLYRLMTDNILRHLGEQVK